MTAAAHSTDPSPAYREHVQASGWFGLLGRVLFIAPLVGAIAAFRDHEMAPTERAVTLVSVGIAGFALLLVSRWFLALDVTVSAEALRFRFGPFGRTLGASALRQARVRSYPWLAFGGWGWRFGRLDGGSAQAYSVPFLNDGVAVTTAEGRTYYISSREPERLVEAIERLQHGTGAA